MTVNNAWSIELGKAESAAVATTRWTGLLRTLGYTVFIVYLVLGILTLIGGVVTTFSDSASTGLPLIGGGILLALLGAIIAAPLLAISSYLAMGAHKSLAEMAHLEQTGRPLNAVGIPTASAPLSAPAPAPVPAPAVAPPPPPAPAPAPAVPATAAPAAPVAAPPVAAPPVAPPPPVPEPAPNSTPPAAAAPPAASPAPPPAAASAAPTLPPTGTPRPGDAPGFYDDPDDPGYVRYWGGSMWTDTRMPKP